MKKLALICIAACSAMVALGAATALAGDTTNFTFAGQGSGDSSTCGPDWATDTYTRVFKVYPERNLDGSYRVVENFTNGHFVTIQGASPESCEAGTSNSVSGNVSGSFHGSETIKTIGGGLYSPAGAAAWDGTGGTAGFIAAAFNGDTPNVSDFYFKYTTGNHAACMNKWINAATGNSGDIATIC